MSMCEKQELLLLLFFILKPKCYHYFKHITKQKRNICQTKFQKYLFFVNHIHTVILCYRCTDFKSTRATFTLNTHTC